MQFIDLNAQQQVIKEKLDARIASVLAAGNYIMGPEVRELEGKLAEFCGAKFAITCANGTDALQIALAALNVGPGEAVFCPSFTFAATAEVVPAFGAVPFFVDVSDDSYNLNIDSLKRSIADARERGLKPAGIIPVDLFGLPAYYDAIEQIAKDENLWILEDSAQGFGATFNGRRTGSFGQIATTSFFPAKPLGCYGDGGAIFTSDEKLASFMDSFRFHGKGTDKYDNVRIGINSRLDTLQAAILLEKLAIYQEEIEKRQIVAGRYSRALANFVRTPKVPDSMTSVWAQYTIRLVSKSERDGLQEHLKLRGIPSVVYYARPLHLQTAYSKFPTDPHGLPVSEALSSEVLSLPMHPYLSVEEQEKVISAITEFLSR